MLAFLRSALLAFLALAAVRAATPAPRFELRDGDRVVFLGDSLVEREQYHGWIELRLNHPPADAFRSTPQKPSLRHQAHDLRLPHEPA